MRRSLGECWRRALLLLFLSLLFFVDELLLSLSLFSCEVFFEFLRVSLLSRKVTFFLLLSSLEEFLGSVPEERRFPEFFFERLFCASLDLRDLSQPLFLLAGAWLFVPAEKFFGEGP